MQEFSHERRQATALEAEGTVCGDAFRWRSSRIVAAASVSVGMGSLSGAEAGKVGWD